MFNVSWQEIYALQLLVKNGHMSLGELGTRLYLEKYQTSQLAAKLENLGYLRRDQNDGDKRVWEISITESGIQKIHEIEAFHYHLFQGELPGVDTKQLRGMHSVITAFSNILERKGLA